MEKVFGLDNNEIFKAKTERIDKQYYIDFVIIKEDVEDTVRKSEIFNSKMIDFISKVNNEDIQKYRKIFNNLLGSEKKI